MHKTKKTIAVALSVIIVLLSIGALFYNNVIYNGAKGTYVYTQGDCTTVNGYYVISLPYFSEEHLEKLISDYIKDTDLFNKLAKKNSSSKYTRICIRFNRPSFKWPLGKKIEPEHADELSTVAGGNRVATCIAVVLTGEQVTSYDYYKE